MIVLAPDVLKQIVDAAEAAYPLESCGLLVGRTHPAGDVEIVRAVPGANQADDPARRFEVDPQLRFDLMRELRGSDLRLAGHFHSHPDGPAQPSAHDLDNAWEPDLVWLITAVAGGQAIHTTAHVLDPAACQFRQVPLRPSDWHPYPARPSS